jgi:hypothetical protein
MKSIKYFLYFLTLYSLFQCRSIPPQTKLFKTEILKRYSKGDSGIIISCFNCKCSIDFMTFYLGRHFENPVFMDTNCIQLRPKGVSYNHIDTKMIDSIFERNYNVILFKNLNRPDSFSFEILKSEEYKDFMKITNKFFNSRPDF